jgi:S-adenosylmethionine synthetase
VTVEYEGYKPVRISAVVFAQQHEEHNGSGCYLTYEEIRETLIEKVIRPVLGPTGLLDANTRYFINPTGRFVIGGPAGDTGLTGRKIIVDTYGGMGRHGGGAFSGKDPTKVDRSAAYMARYIAKNVVAAGRAASCELELAYAIGVPEPISVLVDTFGTEKADKAAIEQAILKVFDLTPHGIIETLQLKNPIYRATAAYGHFGRDNFSWEKTDRVEALRKAIP